jgi:hypothetical protein
MAGAMGCALERRGRADSSVRPDPCQGPFTIHPKIVPSPFFQGDMPFSCLAPERARDPSATPFASVVISDLGPAVREDCAGQDDPPTSPRTLNPRFPFLASRAQSGLSKQVRARELRGRTLYLCEKIFLARRQARWFTHEISHASASIRPGGSERRAGCPSRKAGTGRNGYRVRLATRPGTAQQHCQASKTPE